MLIKELFDISEAKKKAVKKPPISRNPGVTIKLDDEVVKKLAPAIHGTWQQIGHDLLDASPGISNEEAIECVLDANHMSMNGDRGGKEAEELVDKLCKEHGYNKVLSFLASKIRLN